MGSARAVANSPQPRLFKIVRLGCRIWGVNILHIDIHRKIDRDHICHGARKSLLSRVMWG
jgi:hypothetical protein